MPPQEHATASVFDGRATGLPAARAGPPWAVRFVAGPWEEPDRYGIERCVDVGAEGIIYQCSARGGGQRDRVALKAMFIAADGEKLSHHAKQLDLLAEVDHVGVVRLRETFVGPPVHHHGACPPDASVIYIAMNWIDGCTVRDLVESNGGSPGMAGLEPLRTVADALDMLHSGRQTRGVRIVHRDVKPSNVVISRHGVGVLVDYSIASEIEPSEPCLGTPGYRAPEAHLGRYTAASDLFGLAGVAMFMLTGVAPASGEAFDPFDRLLRDVGVSREAAQLLRQARAPDPDERPNGAHRWLVDLLSA